MNSIAGTLADQFTKLNATLPDVVSKLDEILQLLQPPIEDGLLWGYSASQLPGESMGDAIARESAALGAPGILRVYDNNKGPAAAWSYAQSAGAPDIPCVISFKIPPANVLDGSHDNELRAFFDDLTPNQRWCYAHECDAHSQKGEYTPQQFIDAWKRVYSIYSNSECEAKAVLILTGYLIDQRLPVFYPGDDCVDEVAIDPYSYGSGDTAQIIMQNAYNLVTAKGKKLGIAETGMPASYGIDAQKTFVQSLSWIKDQPDISFITYFNYDEMPGNSYRIDNKPDVAAIFKELND